MLTVGRCLYLTDKVSGTRTLSSILFSTEFIYLNCIIETGASVGS